MKPGKAELTAKHWVSFRPEGVDDRGQLEKALGKAEKTLQTQRKKSADARALEQAQKALGDLPKLLAKAIKECDRKTHKDEIKGLQELQSLVDEELSQLESAQTEQEAGGDEDNDDKIFESDYVHKLIKLIRSSNKELNFSFGLDMNAPEACQLLLHRKKSSEMLFKILKKTKRFPNRLMTYGLARVDTQDKATLVFELAAGANVPPNKIVRIARKMFQQDKKLRFKKLKVVAPNGQTFEDTDPEEVAAATADGTAADLSQQRQQAEDYMQSWQQALEQVSSQVGNIRQAMSSMREDASAGAIYEALGAYDGLANVQREFPDLDLSKLVDAAARNDQSLYDQTLTQTAREVDQARRELTELRPLLNALDDNPFGIPTNADDTVTRVLEEIATGLGV